MDVDFIFQVAGIGIIVAVLNQLLVRSGREEQAMLTTLAGLIVVLVMVVLEEASGSIRHKATTKEVDGKLQLFGYTSVMSEKHISFMSDKVNTQQTDASHGYLLYEYVSDIRALDLGGCVLLKWYKKHSYAKVKRMTGQYFGVKSREMGTLLYQRISKEEFDNISRCDFLRNAEG